MTCFRSVIFVKRYHILTSMTSLGISRDMRTVVEHYGRTGVELSHGIGTLLINDA